MSDHPLNLLHPSLGLAFPSAQVLRQRDAAATEATDSDAEDIGGFPIGDDEE